jgi:hypothetical protein
MAESWFLVWTENYNYSCVSESLINIQEYNGMDILYSIFSDQRSKDVMN